MPNPILSPPTFLAYSLGCRTNQAEVESICSQLMAYGFKPFNLCSFEALKLCSFPNVVLLNTCVVTLKAEKETRQKIRELRKKYPKSFLAVLGCGVTAKEKLGIDLPEADLFIANEEKYRTVEYIRSKLLFEQCREQSKECFSTSLRSARRISILNRYIQSGRKFIKIQDGCDKFCSYCLTCYLRGKPTSIPPEEIIKEINFWVERGIKEIILTGINIGLYGTSHDNCHSDQAKRVEESLSPPLERDPSTTLGMTYLINKILSETKVERISFSSIYPEMLTQDFLKVVINNPRISQYFHLSLQSGSPTVLERMDRKTYLKKLAKRLSWIKKQNPLFTFRADIITGFPEETEKEFEESLEFIRKTKISFVHSFLFSVRPETKAEGMIKSGKWRELPMKIKKQRAEILKKEVGKIREKETKKMIGLPTQCLIIKNSVIARGLSPKQSPNQTRLLRRPAPRNDREIFAGITENGWVIKIFNDQSLDKLGTGFSIFNLIGKIIPVKIIGFEKNYLVGEITSLPTN